MNIQNLDEAQNSVYYNAVKSLQEAVYKTNATSSQVKKGRRNNGAAELEKAMKELHEDMRSLMNSPYTNIEQPAACLDLDARSINALRSVLMRIRDVKNSGSDTDEDRLGEAVRLAVNALDPARNLKREDFEVAYGKQLNKGKSTVKATRKSECFRAKTTKNYDESAGDGDDIEDLIRGGDDGIGLEGDAVEENAMEEDDGMMEDGEE